MSKTLTEQWRDGTLPDGYYYIDYDTQQRIFEIEDGCATYQGLPAETYFLNDVCLIKVIAPVPSYRQLYGPNDGNIPVGLFTVLKLIKRDIEQYQKIRPLTDLECGIKSQVVSLLKRYGVE